MVINKNVLIGITFPLTTISTFLLRSPDLETKVNHGARSRSRTGTEFPPRDFHTHYDFRRRNYFILLGSGLSLHHIAERLRKEPSSLYTFRTNTAFGLARDCQWCRTAPVRFPRI